MRHTFASCLLLCTLAPRVLAAQPDFECQVSPPTLNKQALLRQKGVQSVSLSPDKRNGVLLMRHGRAVYIRHIGCADLAFSVSTWIDEVPGTQSQQLNAAKRFGILGLGRYLPSDLRWHPSEFEPNTDPSEGLKLQHRELNLQVYFILQGDGTYVLHLVYSPES